MWQGVACACKTWPVVKYACNAVGVQQRTVEQVWGTTATRQVAPRIKNAPTNAPVQTQVGAKPALNLSKPSSSRAKPDDETEQTRADANRIARKFADRRHPVWEPVWKPAELATNQTRPSTVVAHSCRRYPLIGTNGVNCSGTRRQPCIQPGRTAKNAQEPATRCSFAEHKVTGTYAKTRREGR